MAYLRNKSNSYCYKSLAKPMQKFVTSTNRLILPRGYLPSHVYELFVAKIGILLNWRKISLSSVETCVWIALISRDLPSVDERWTEE